MNNLARRAHPFTSGAVALALIALAVSLPAPIATLTLFGVTVVMAVACGAGRGVRVGLIAALPLCTLLFVMQGIFGDGVRISTPWGGSLSEAGLAWTLSQGSRLATIITASAAFATTFDPHRFLQAAVARRWPFGLAFLIVAALDAAEHLGVQAKRLREAQRTRGLPMHGSLAIRARAIPALVFPLLLASLTEADDHALALETRGLAMAGRRTALDPPADSGADRMVRWLAVVSVLAAVAWRVSR